MFDQRGARSRGRGDAPHPRARLGLTGIGRHLVLARFATPLGPFISATWPGYADVLTAMAPGRFAAAINQAPRLAASGIGPVDDVLNRLRMLRLEGALPAPHLLRRVCETAPDYGAALAMLADERIKLAMPALFILSGVARGEGAIVEALGRSGTFTAPPSLTTLPPASPMTGSTPSGAAVLDAMRRNGRNG